MIVLVAAGDRRRSWSCLRSRLRSTARSSVGSVIAVLLVIAGGSSSVPSRWARCWRPSTASSSSARWASRSALFSSSSVSAVGKSASRTRPASRSSSSAIALLRSRLRPAAAARVHDGRARAPRRSGCSAPATARSRRTPRRRHRDVLPQRRRSMVLASTFVLSTTPTSLLGAAHAHRQRHVLAARPFDPDGRGVSAREQVPHRHDDRHDLAGHVRAGDDVDDERELQPHLPEQGRARAATRSWCRRTPATTSKTSRAR